MVYQFSGRQFDRDLYRFNVSEIWYSPWYNDVAFNLLHTQIRQNTLITRRKLFDLLQIAGQVRPIQGSVLEVGSWRGGSGALLANLFRDRPLVMWDCWGDDVSKDDYFVRKEYAGNEDCQAAQALLNGIGAYEEGRVSFRRGLFPSEELRATLQYPLAFVHFDIYSAEAFEQGIEQIWPHLSVGGIFVVGAYGSISLNPLTDAVNRFVASHDCLFIQSQSGMACLIRR
jgi:O-methyltransferase